MKKQIFTLFLAFTAMITWSQGIPVSGVVVNANSSINVIITYVDSLNGTSTTLEVATEPSGAFNATLPVNGIIGPNQYVAWACIENCNAETICDFAVFNPGTIMVFELNYCGSTLTDSDGDGFDSSVAFEECNNGIDNNCNGLIDEGCGGDTTGCVVDIVLLTDSMLGGAGSPFVVWILNNTPNANPLSNYTYSWSLGNGASVTGEFPTYVYTETGTYTVCLTISDANSACTASDCVTFTVDSNGNVFPGGAQIQGFTLNVVGQLPDIISEIQNNESISVYPNPVQESTNLSINSEVNQQGTLSVYSLEGTLIQSSQMNVRVGKNTQIVSTSELQSGWYLFKWIGSNGQIYTTSFVK
jgi:hypothetical protein